MQGFLFSKALPVAEFEANILFSGCVNAPKKGAGATVALPGFQPALALFFWAAARSYSCRERFALPLPAVSPRSGAGGWSCDVDRVGAHLDGQAHLADHVAGRRADDMRRR